MINNKSETGNCTGRQLGTWKELVKEKFREADGFFALFFVWKRWDCHLLQNHYFQEGCLKELSQTEIIREEVLRLTDKLKMNKSLTPDGIKPKGS